MIRLQPKDMPDQEEENKKANQNVVENTVFFFLTVAVIRAGKYREADVQQNPYDNKKVVLSQGNRAMQQLFVAV